MTVETLGNNLAHAIDNLCQVGDSVSIRTRAEQDQRQTLNRIWEEAEEKKLAKSALEALLPLFSLDGNITVVTSKPDKEYQSAVWMGYVTDRPLTKNQQKWLVQLTKRRYTNSHYHIGSSANKPKPIEIIAKCTIVPSWAIAINRGNSTPSVYIEIGDTYTDSGWSINGFWDKDSQIWKVYEPADYVTRIHWMSLEDWMANSLQLWSSQLNHKGDYWDIRRYQIPSKLVTPVRAVRAWMMHR